MTRSKKRSGGKRSAKPPTQEPAPVPPQTRSTLAKLKTVLIWSVPLAFVSVVIFLIVMVNLTEVPVKKRKQDSKTEIAKPPSKAEVLLAKRKELNQTVWAKEVLAQQYEETLVHLWDSLLEQDAIDRAGGSSDKFAVFENIPLQSITIAKTVAKETLDWGIELFICTGKQQQLNHAQWVEAVRLVKKAGYRLIQSEWHHASFEPSEDGTAKSTVSMLLHLTHEPSNRRIIIRGKLKIHWAVEKDKLGHFVPQTIDAVGLQMLTRFGEVPFEEMLTVDPSKPNAPSGIHPLIVYDIDGDGLSEILLGGCNRLYWNLGDGKFKQDKLCGLNIPTFEVGVVADFTGDGIADYVTPELRGNLLMYRGDKKGRFNSGPVVSGTPQLRRGPLTQPQAITAGDVDGDGDLDLFVGQYKISYVAGQMPTPYYDANDGFPAYLMINDGKGRFSDQTEKSGLAPKRNRRTYTASFVDLDKDGDLDLLVVSDFSGIDVYTNDGKGHFTDVTDSQVDERHLFGMSVTFADYNLDGRLDFFVSGMASTTSRRLDLMKSGRSEHADIHKMRSLMGYGNRMYLNRNDGFRQPAFQNSVARTGWTWGATSPDFDNDGDRDIYVANGHSSGKSTKDHCTHFWCHDIYDSKIKQDTAIYDVFKQVHSGYLDRSESWDGYQKNVLLMNRDGKEFVSIGFLMGVAKQYDARAAVSEDLDGDGLVDLLVVEDNWKQGQVLHVYRNRLKTNNNWIGVRLKEEGKGRSPVGVQIIVYAAGRKQIGGIITGDSIHAQHANTQHFGLGKTKHVEKIEVRWPNGGPVRVIENPTINQYHNVTTPKTAAEPSTTNKSSP